MSIAKKILMIVLLVASVAGAAIAMLTWTSATVALHEMEVKRVTNSVEREARIQVRVSEYGNHCDTLMP